ncbi:MAG: deaminase [Candidatus Paceibacterota bacterium]
MRHLKNQEEEDAEKFIAVAAAVARKATCVRARCGSIVVSDGEIIGKGFNSPAGHLESQRRCDFPKEGLHRKVTDKTCCIHAEQRAIFDALKNAPDKIEGATLYFTRIGKEDHMEKSGKPYCTICSKSALDIGIKEFVLWHEDGICAYDTAEYNLLSFDYQE